MFLDLQTKLNKVGELCIHADPSKNKHIEELEKLQNEHAHNIVVIEAPKYIPTCDYNCFMHALGVHTDERIYKLRDKYRSIMDSNFVINLIKQEILTLKARGKVILYFNEQILKHGGQIVSKNRVRSKWGTGYLFEHDIWEVPQKYGNKVQRFSLPKAAIIKNEFEKYLKRKYK